MPPIPNNPSRIIVPTDAPLNVQAALKALQDQIDFLKATVPSDTVSSLDLQRAIDAAKKSADAAVKALDMAAYTPNDIFRGAGPAHSTGVVPDPGPAATLVGDEYALHSDGNWRRVLDGVVRVVPSLRSNPALGTSGKSLAQRIVNILGGLAVLGDMAAHSGYFRRLNVAGGLIQRGGTYVNPNGITAAINIICWQAPWACTVEYVKGYRVGGTGATINARNNGANNHLSSALSLTSADTWMDGGAVQNVTYAPGDKLEIMVVSVTGSPTQVEVQVGLRMGS